MKQEQAAESTKMLDAGEKKKLGFFARIILFVRQVIDELKKVVAPSRRELRNFFLVVVGFVVIMMLFVSVIDQLFGWLAVLVFGSPLT